MKNVTLVSYCLLVMAIGGCQVKSGKNFDKFEWLNGHWRASGEDTYFYESWERKKDTLYTGLAYTLVDGDTVFSEKMSIAEEGGRIYLTTSPADSEVIAFQLLRASENEIIFENPLHDYPRRITYKRLGSDSLYVKIQGKAMGAEQGQEIYFQKLK